MRIINCSCSSCCTRADRKAAAPSENAKTPSKGPCCSNVALTLRAPSKIELGSFPRKKWKKGGEKYSSTPSVWSVSMLEHGQSRELYPGMDCSLYDPRDAQNVGFRIPASVSEEVVLEKPGVQF